MVDDATLVQIEVDPSDDFIPAGAESVVGRVRDAIGPAVDAAKVVLEKVKETRPHEVELKFGVKVSGGASWLIAKAVAEGNFEITLTWRAENDGTRASSGSQVRADAAAVAPEGEKWQRNDEQQR
jgi:hypothetical protein